MYATKEGMRQNRSLRDSNAGLELRIFRIRAQFVDNCDAWLLTFEPNS
jgi:hypothetical protein